ncbi:MAG: hypothetical protein MHPSP_001478 [Paramarteilia canceri]
MPAPIMPRFGRVLVRILGEKASMSTSELGSSSARSASGLLLPQTFSDESRNFQIGQVSALPNDISDESKKVKDLNLNSQVILPKYTSQKFTFGNDEFVLATSGEILGVIANSNEDAMAGAAQKNRENA